MLDLVSSFEALRPPDAGAGTASRFSAIPIPGGGQHRLGKDSEGAPSLLFTVVDGRASALPPPIVLEHLTVVYGVDCRVTQPDGSVEERKFTVVRCTGTDRVLHSYFLRVAVSIVRLLGEQPSYMDVSRAVDGLVELFRSMATAPRKSVQGLWAELLLMARLRDPAPLAAAWHVLPGDRYDFSAGDHRIEVKSATGRVRQHHFTLEQLLPVPGTQVLVVSVLVERAAAGTALVDLVREVRSRTSDAPQLLLHVDRVVAQTLGDGWRHAQEQRFDRQLAESSLAFYEPAVIPQVDANLPRGVSNVQFVADLTGAPSADLRAYRSKGGLFAAALRR